MNEKVIIPNRGVIAQDIIDSLKSIGLETILLHAPEDANSLAVKLADRSYKFYSSRIEDSYMDMDAIIEQALELKADYIHPGYGFLTEEPEFARRVVDNNLQFIGPGEEILSLVRDKIECRKRARKLGIPVLKHSDIISSPVDAEKITQELHYPLIIKPVRGSGGQSIRVLENRRTAQDHLREIFERQDTEHDHFMLEEYLGSGHHIEIPFFRDVGGNILFLPEIESSIQRRFQKILQESPSINITQTTREDLYHHGEALVKSINYVGLGYLEFIVYRDKPYFSEINPSFQINTLIPEVHIISNFIKKQFAISRGEQLHHVEGTEVVEPKYTILLASLMAENPYSNFQPSSGTVSYFFNYSSIRNLFKTSIYTGARISPLYAPYIGKIVTFSVRRETAINDMKNFLENIQIRGISTNLYFLKCLLACEPLARGETHIDFLNSKWNFANRRKDDQDIKLAAALLAAAFHMDNRRRNFKSDLAKMKQPGLLKRLFKRF